MTLIFIHRPCRLTSIDTVSGTLEVLLVGVHHTGFPANEPWPDLIDHVDQVVIQGYQRSDLLVLDGAYLAKVLEDIRDLFHDGLLFGPSLTCRLPLNSVRS